MRCEVLVTQEMKNQYLNGQSQINTDIEIWREATVYKTALTLSGPRELVKVFSRDGKASQGKKLKTIAASPSPPAPDASCSKVRRFASKISRKQKPLSNQLFTFFQTSTKREKVEERNNSPDSGDGDVNNTKDTCDNNDLVDSALPPSDKKQRMHEFQKLKANCKPEELLKLKQRCEVNKIRVKQKKTLKSSLT